MKFDFNQWVTIALSNRSAKVIGYTTYNGLYPDTYYLQYLDGNGDQVRSWVEVQDLI